MKILVMTLRLHAPWAGSLKEKRSEVSRLCAALRSRFNVSVAETDDRDLHKIIGLGIAAVVPDASQADSLKEKIQKFIEGFTEAELESAYSEIL